MTELPITLTNRHVRDLAWACFSPPLLHTQKLADDQHNVANCGLSLTPTRTAWLQQLDHNPGPLLDYLAQQSHTRLGLYFEQLWHFFLAQDPAVELVAHNLAVREGQQTLGEFDCLYYCHQRKRHYHLELAVKYFLGYDPLHKAASPSSWQSWLGPNNRDRLDLKVDHMMQRQIRLPDKAAAKEVLDSLGINTLASEVDIKGWLFSNPTEPVAPPHGHNTARPLQRWLRFEDLAGLLATQEYTGLALLPRLQWLAPVLQSSTEVLPVHKAQAQLQPHFEKARRPVLVVAFSDSAEETCRFFVTGQGWPADQSG